MSRRPPKGPRARAVLSIKQVVEAGRSLRSVAKVSGADEDAALATELTYGVLRWYWPLAHRVDALLAKPIRKKDSEIYYLLLVGAYQLTHTRIPPHAAVSETVSECNALARPWASRLVNGILRNLIRNQSDAQPADTSDDDRAIWSHPTWMIDAFRNDWPHESDAIFAAGNERPLMFLRTNRAKTSRDGYLDTLRAAAIGASGAQEADDAILLDKPMPVHELPGFDDGVVSVQDLSAQLVADIVAAAPGHRILDACAAPGGKSLHLLERCDKLDRLVALDVDPERIELLSTNLRRIGVDPGRIELKIADATLPLDLAEGDNFDTVLLDAPCSGTGVISRHPDIKHLRHESDLPVLSLRQDRLLDRLWSRVQTGGQLVYVTCSILHEENAARMQAFAARQADAAYVDPGEKFGLDTKFGRQRLPGVHAGDGFFYAIFRRSESREPTTS